MDLLNIMGDWYQIKRWVLWASRCRKIICFRKNTDVSNQLRPLCNCLKINAKHSLQHDGDRLWVMSRGSPPDDWCFQKLNGCKDGGSTALQTAFWLIKWIIKKINAEFALITLSSKVLPLNVSCEKSHHLHWPRYLSPKIEGGDKSEGQN